MPETVEAPPPATRHLPEALRPFIWTRDEAKQAALRSVAARQQRAAAQPLDASTPTVKDGVSTVINAQLRLVAEQITRTRSTLNDEEYHYCEHCERGGIEPHHRAQLLKALDTLLDRQRKLMGISDPGTLRPATGKTRGQPAAARPWVPVVAPEPAPDTPIGSVPPVNPQ